MPQGATELLRRLAAQPPAATAAAAQAAAVEAAARQAQKLAAPARLLARPAQAAAQAARARAQPGCSAGAAGGRPPQAPPGQAGRRRAAQACTASVLGSAPPAPPPPAGSAAAPPRPAGAPPPPGPPLVAIPGARSHPAEVRDRRQLPHPATRGSPAARACLGPRAHDDRWAGSFRRGACWVSLFPRGSAREGCARPGVQGVDPLLLISGWQPSLPRGQPGLLSWGFHRPR
jgi:hypothetical protein